VGATHETYCANGLLVVRAVSYRASALSLLVSPHGDGEQPRDGVAAIVPAVASAVLDDDVTWFEHDFGAVVEFETDGPIENDVVVHRCRAVHTRFVRIRPWHERGMDELVEVVTLRGYSITASEQPPGGGN